MVIGHFDAVLGDLAPVLCGEGVINTLPYNTQFLLTFMLMCPSDQVWNGLLLPVIVTAGLLLLAYIIFGYRYKTEVIDYKPYATYKRLTSLAASQKLKENTVCFKEYYWGLFGNLQVFLMACACPYLRLLDTFTAFDLIEESQLPWHMFCIHSFPACYLCCYAPYMRTKMRQKLGSTKECTCMDCCMICCLCNFGIAQLSRVADKSTGVGTKFNCTLYEMSTGSPIAKPVRIKEKRESVAEK